MKKIGEKIKYNLDLLEKGSRRFPLSLILNLALTISLLVLNNMDYEKFKSIKLVELSISLFIGYLMFLNLELLLESKNKKTLKIRYSPIVFLGIYFIYKFTINNTGNLLIYKISGLVVFLLVLLFYIGRIKRNNIESYILDILRGFFISLLYSIVLSLGLIFTIQTINLLFELSLEGEIFLNILILSYVTMFLTSFMAHFPESDHIYEDRTMSKTISILFKYILVPLILIYTGILYLYFGKIVVTGILPQGVLSNLILWYSLISFGVLFFIDNLDRKNKISNFYRKYFPYLNIISLLVLFYAVFLRVNEYGITENRYYIFLAGLWIFINMLYYAIKEERNKYYSLVSLSLVILISIVGPLSSTSLSIRSQNKRFVKILKNKSALESRSIDLKKLDKRDLDEIDSILTYFKYKYSPDNLFLYDDNKEILDKRLENLDEYTSRNEFYYNDYTNRKYDLGDYNYLITLNSNGKEDLDNYSFITENNIISINKDLIELERLELNEIFSEEIIKDKKENENNLKGPYIYDGGEKLKYKLIIKNIYGSLGEEKIDIEYFELDILIK